MNTIKIWYRPMGQEDPILIHQTYSAVGLLATITALVALAQAEGNECPDFKLTAYIDGTNHCMPFNARSISFIADQVTKWEANDIEDLKPEPQTI